MSRETRDTLRDLLTIRQQMELLIIKRKDDGEGLTSLSLALQFLDKAIAVWTKKMEQENKE